MMTSAIPTRRRACIGLGLAAAACGHPASGDASPGHVKCRFFAQVGGRELRMDGTRYANPGGTGQLEIHDFKFYMSNIVLRDRAGAERFTEPDSYHLARFPRRGGAYEIDLRGVAQGRYDAIDLSIGVDPSANGTLDPAGDLDPNGQMAWNWMTGYKFLALEGTYYPEDEPDPVPIVYHIGFSESYRELSFDLRGALEVGDGVDPVLSFSVELGEIFDNPNRIDIAQRPSILFDTADASRVASNYERMVGVRELGGSSLAPDPPAPGGADAR